jgi:hypothetical protein
VALAQRGACLRALIDSLEADLPTLKEPLLRITGGFVFDGAARALRFGERSHTTAQSDLGESTSSLLSPFGSRGCGKSARTGAAGEAKREVGSDLKDGTQPEPVVE